MLHADGDGNGKSRFVQHIVAKSLMCSTC